MDDELEALRVEMTRALESRRKKLVRKRDAIGKDLARVADAEELARLASLAVPTASGIPRGSASVSVVDYANGGATTSVPLDPARPARESLDRIFKNARRLRHGEPVARARLGETTRAIEALERAVTAVAAATEAGAIRAACEEALPLAPARGPGRAPQERKPPYRLFRAPHGDVWVGRGAARNDELTFRVAKPYHLWLHVRGSPGAHVVIPLGRGKVPSAETLVDAAHLAAHFSDMRGEVVVEVTYVPRKFVRKPRGAPPGAVTMEREKVLALRVDAARTEHLLTTEVA